MEKYPDKFTFWRNVLISAGCGSLFASGWWLYIDVEQSYRSIMSENRECILPGLGSTVAAILVFLIPYPVSHRLIFYERCKCTPKLLWILLFFGLVGTFSAFIWSIYVWIVIFILPKDVPCWPGAAVFLQNLFIACSSLIFKFSIKYPE